MEREKALLIGNGINRIGDDQGYVYSLNSLMERLRDYSKSDIDLDNDLKPFPLSFEEILAGKDKSHTEGQKVLKKAIADMFATMTPNDVHRLCVNSKAKHIITTNYDYCFELALQGDFTSKKTNSTREYKHSLERKYSFPGAVKTIWHINGELDSYVSPNNQRDDSHDSILIGYDQYCSYLTKMQLHAYPSAKDNKSLITRLKKYQETGTVDISYWSDFFFTHDLAVVGFGFDFSEIHLWWLLSYRNMLFRDNKIEKRYRNKITCYYKKPIKDEDDRCDSKRYIRERRLAATRDILRAMQVKPIPIECRDYNEFYEIVLREKEKLIT